jgi:predicted XRE-type DNA-binding protein
MSDELELTWGSGNVFADLGLEDPDLLLAKADLAIAITNIIRERGLTQTAAASELGVDQARISAIMRGRLDDFSLQRLMAFARLLGQDVRITVTPSADPARPGRMTTQTSNDAVAASGNNSQPETVRFD